MDNLPIRMFIIGLILALVAVCIVFAVEQFIQPAYFMKSAVKVAMFGGSIGVFSLVSKKKTNEVVRFHQMKKSWVILAFMAGAYLIMGTLFFLFKGQIDLSGIRESLVTKEKLTKENCIIVFLYIVCVNSFLEEIFFRGFIFQLFKNKILGTCISALLFSVYHIGIFVTWFNPFIFGLCLLGLFVVGVLLQYIGLKFKSILASWMIHAAANIAINGIGALLIFNLIH